MCYWLHHHNIYVKTMLRTKKYNMYYWLHHHSFMWRHWRKPKMTRWTTDCITTTSMWRQCCKPKLTRWTTDCMTTHLCGGNDANQNWQDVPLIAWPLIYVETMLLTKNDKMNHWLHHHNVYVEAMLLTKNDKMNHWLHDHNVYVETMLKTKNDKVHHWLHHHSSMWRRCCKQKNNQDVQTNADALVPFPTIPNRVSFLTSAPAATSSYPVSSLNALVSITFRPFCASSLRTAQFVDAPLNIVPSYQSPPNPFQGSYPLQLAHSDQQRLFLYRKNN